METAVSTGDTWGISGPTFLMIHAALMAAGCGLALGWRRWVRRRAVADADLHPVELAYLIGGPNHAAMVAYVGLCRRGAIRVPEAGGAAAPQLLGPDELVGVAQAHRPVVVGPVRGHPVEMTLAAELGRYTDPAELLAVVRASPDMDAIRGRLAALGLVDDDVPTLRVGAVPLLFVLVVGLARLGDGASNGKPVGFLVLLMAATGALTGLAWRLPRRPPAAKALIARVRRHQRESTRAEERADELRKRGTFEVGAPDVEGTPDPMTVAALGPSVAWAAAPLLLASGGFVPPDFTMGTGYYELTGRPAPGSGFGCAGGGGFGCGGGGGGGSGGGGCGGGGGGGGGCGG